MNSQNSKDLSTKYLEKLHIFFSILFEHYDVKFAMSNPILKQQRGVQFTYILCNTKTKPEMNKKQATH